MHTVLIVKKSDFNRELSDRYEIEKKLLANASDPHFVHFYQLEQQYENWDDYNSEFLKQSFNNPNNEYKLSYDTINNGIKTYKGGFWETHPSMAEDMEILKIKVTNKLVALGQLITKIPLIKSEVDSQVNSEPIKHEGKINNDNIFIVHGHNRTVLLEVARTIERFGLKPVILQEQPNSGRTIIEKFEDTAEVGFAIILLTSDDLGKSKNSDELKNRARQNVILELGYFMAKLGRKKNMRTLYN